LALVGVEFREEKRLDVFRAEGGELLLSLPDHSAADWLPDGTLLYADSEARKIFRTSLEGEAETFADLEPATVEKLLVSPDGGRALLTLRLPYGQYPTVLSLLDVESGEVLRLVEEDGWLGEAAWSPDGSRILYTRGPFRYRSGSQLPYANLHSCDIATGNITPLTREEGFAGLGVWGSVPNSE
jgi:dipeptidyl aminopeptidase/acylaminoacyl peptidase